MSGRRASALPGLGAKGFAHSPGAGTSETRVSRRGEEGRPPRLVSPTPAPGSSLVLSHTRLERPACSGQLGGSSWDGWFCGRLPSRRGRTGMARSSWPRGRAKPTALDWRGSRPPSKRVLAQRAKSGARAALAVSEPWLLGSTPVEQPPAGSSPIPDSPPPCLQKGLGISLVSDAPGKGHVPLPAVLHSPAGVSSRKSDGQEMRIRLRALSGT